MIAIVLIGVILLCLIAFGMAKWTSVLFSDARNKLGDQVVFTNWKGRTVMRAYKKPANPNTLGQQAQRDKNRLSVSTYQGLVAPEATAVTKYNELALNRRISGFNLFMKYALAIDISCPAAVLDDEDIPITYTIPVDLSEMAMYEIDTGTGTLSQIVAQGELEAGVDKVFNAAPHNVDTYNFFIGPAEVFNELAGNAKEAVRAAHWKANGTTGIADPATVVVSAA